MVFCLSYVDLTCIEYVRSRTHTHVRSIGALPPGRLLELSLVRSVSPSGQGDPRQNEDFAACIMRFVTKPELLFGVTKALSNEDLSKYARRNRIGAHAGGHRG